uniref:Protein Gawky n=1 Tax=Panagrellus redivivus TaxID=6233 RepID=A0A7E4VKX6_PANRE
MMFGDEGNGYFPGGSVDTVWKPHPTHNDLNNHNSKLSTWAPPGSRGNNKNDFVYDDASAKAAWNGRGLGGPSGGDNKPGNNAWGPPSNADPLGTDILDQELMHMNIGKPPDGFGHGGGGQWGRQEVNQATPWNVDAGGAMGGRPPFGGPDGMHPPGRGFMQQQLHFDNEPTSQWRGQWDMDFGNKPGPGPDFGGPPFGNMPMGNQFGHGRHNFVPPQQQAYNDRMMHNGPHFSHGHRQPQQQPWMNDKFGNNGHHGMHHPMNGPNNGGRFPFGHPGQQPPHGGPPSMMMQPGRPPLMPMQPPHHNHHPGASVNAVPPAFAMGTFQPQVQNDDSMWQDPNGDLRKWQRDTGTALWGDPAKQNSSEIRRWIQPPNDEDAENLHHPDPLREGKDELESGWGPPPAPPGQKSQPVAAAPQPPVQPIGGGWSDGPRGPPPSNFGMAPGSNSFVHVPPHANNGWSAAPAAPAQAAPAADWTRAGPPPFAAPPLGGFDFQVPVQHTTNDTEASKIATKLRLAVSKNLLDMNLLNSSGALTNHHLATSTLNLLNTMLNHVAHVEHLEARKESIAMDPSRKMEVDRINAEMAEVKAELDQYRDKIHNALSAPRVSLADELASIDNLPSSGVDLPTPLGNEVGQLW